MQQFMPQTAPSSSGVSTDGGETQEAIGKRVVFPFLRLRQSLGCPLWGLISLLHNGAPCLGWETLLRSWLGETQHSGTNPQPPALIPQLKAPSLCILSRDQAVSQPGPLWPRFASPGEPSGGCLSRAVTRVAGMRARSDVCSEMRLAMMPPVLTNGLSLLCDSRQRWKKPMRSLAASLPRELHAASTPSLAGWAGPFLRALCAWV